MRKQIVALAAATALGMGGALVAVAPAQANTTCTYTQGYYKTHLAVFASVDLTASLEAGILAKTGATDLLSLYKTPPQGNADIIAAHQLITAALNGAPGETGFTGAVGDAFYALTGYFEGTVTLTRAQIIAYAATLDAYNNGLLGVPHC